MSADEATALRENFVEGLKAFWESADNVITFTNRKHSEAYIWQTIDEEDTGFLADVLLAMGLRNRAVAAAVRGIVQARASLRVGSILLPRFVQTVNFYAENGGLVIGIGGPK